MDRTATTAVEALAEGLEDIISARPPTPLPAPLHSGRWRAQESHVVWEQPASRVAARIRAAMSPFGGAWSRLGETTIWLEDAMVVAEETPQGWLPGTIVSVDQGLVVATGKGLIRVERLRPGWRPARPAGEYAIEVGAAPGYQFI